MHAEQMFDHCTEKGNLDLFYDRKRKDISYYEQKIAFSIILFSKVKIVFSNPLKIYFKIMISNLYMTVINGWILT